MKRVNYGGPSFVVFLEVMCTFQAQNTSKKESLDLEKDQSYVTSEIDPEYKLGD